MDPPFPFRIAWIAHAVCLRFVDSSLVKTRDYLKDRPGALMDEEFRKEVRQCGLLN